MPPVVTAVVRSFCPPRITISREIAKWVHCFRFTSYLENVVVLFGPYHCSTLPVRAAAWNEAHRLVIAGLLATRQAMLVVLFGCAGIPTAHSSLVALARAKLGQTRDFASRRDANGNNVRIVGTDFAVAPRDDAFGRWLIATLFRVNAPFRLVRTRRRSGNDGTFRTATAGTDRRLAQGNGLIARGGTAKLHVG
jgi:hypothetical protein